MTNTRYYDGIAKGYDELHKDEQMKKLAIALKQIREKVSFDEKSLIGLDVGAGTGFSLDILALETGFSWIGLEPSLGMVKQYSGNQQLLLARAESLPFPDDYADLCISLTAIQNFDDFAKGIEEMSRVTKLDALIIISCLKKSPKLTDITEAIADFLIVENALEEEKDIIFVCKNKKHVFSEEDE